MTRSATGIAPELLVGLEIRRSDGTGAGGRRGGRGLFVTEPVAPGTRILRFGGPLLDHAGLLGLRDRDHYLQIGPDLFLGPSGDLDDYANHSCDPSARVVVEPSHFEASLEARRGLVPDDEVTFDYSTVQLGDPDCRIDDCRCGAAGCRRVIQDFSLMPRRQQKGLVRSGLCAWYLLDAFERALGSSATLRAPQQRSGARRWWHQIR